MPAVGTAGCLLLKLHLLSPKVAATFENFAMGTVA